MKALEVQVGGNYYKNFPIQPVEFITANKLGFLEGCIIKRLCRRKPDDLQKIKHEIDLLIELEMKYNGSPDPQINLKANRSIKNKEALMIIGTEERKIKKYAYIDRMGESISYICPREGEEFIGIPYGWLSHNSLPFIEVRKEGITTSSINIEEVAEIIFDV